MLAGVVAGISLAPYPYSPDISISTNNPEHKTPKPKTAACGDKNGVPPSQVPSGIAAVASQKSALEANWGSKLDPLCSTTQFEGVVQRRPKAGAAMQRYSASATCYTPMEIFII